MNTRFAQIRTAIPGPRSQALRAEETEYLAPGTQGVSQLAGIAVDHGHGALVSDVDGNTFIDFVAGICVASLGHGHPALATALGVQASKIAAGSFTSEPRTRLLERIGLLAGKIVPGSKLKRTQLYSGGAEAVESALRLARAYTKKYEVVAFWGGFHGKTAGVLGLMGSDFKHGLGPLPTGNHLAPYPDCYRCPFQLSYPSCGLACVDFLRQLIKLNTAGSLAAIIVEPIQGTAGNVIPPPDWLAAVKSVAREFDALLVLDEMITGFGRTGKMFGAEHFGVEADIMTFGKGVASGYPLTGVVSTDEIMDPAKCDPWGRPSFSSSSYGGGPLGAAAGDAVTRAIVEEKLPEHAAVVGDAMLFELQKLKDKYPFVGDVRGKGLMIAVELVKDKKTREPLDKKTCEWIFQACLKRGLLSMAYAPRVRINPPLVISRDEALEGIAVMDEVFAELAARWPV
ncbi:MAG: aspartate aminotransferase family protein [Myxococcales bacterium]|nr:aspartate aminotransferase family protein [Myxococcales bacterium]